MLAKPQDDAAFGSIHLVKPGEGPDGDEYQRDRSDAEAAGGSAWARPIAPPAPTEDARQAPLQIAHDFIEIGRTLTYTLTVRHDGGETVSSALATLALPFGLELLAVVPGQGSCGGDPTVVCDLGALAAGQQATVTVDVLVARGGVLEATAVVSSSVTDPEVADNEVVESTQVEDPPA